MKYISLTAIVAIFVTNMAFSQFAIEEDKSKENLRFYPTVNLLIGNPIQDFWENYSKDRLWGFNFDFVCVPFKKAAFIQPGAQFELYPGAASKDTWDGIEVKTSSDFIRFNFITRFKPQTGSRLDPYLELGYGLNMSSTTTSYEIVDEATFWEEFLFEEDDEIETVRAKEFEDYSQNFYAGIGVNLYSWLNLQIKYNFCPTVEYVQKEDVHVTQTSIDYDISSSKMQMVVICVGFNLEKAFANLK